jgi:type IV pilus biogenesis protein CpaD/CtpE
MKKILSVVALIAISASLVACGGKKEEPVNAAPAVVEEPAPATTTEAAPATTTEAAPATTEAAPATTEAAPAPAAPPAK